MKRLISAALALVFALTLSGLTASVPARALMPDNVNAYSSVMMMDGVNNVAQDQADMLKALGLFLGTNNGYELLKPLNRAEAAVLTVRVMGEEKNALSQKNKHPFTDVPAWADRYVGWLYQHGLIGGVSKTLYGGARSVTYREFATLLCLAATGEEDYIGHGIGTEREQRIIDGEDGYSPDIVYQLYRDEAVSLLTRFLGVTHTRDARPAKPDKPADPVITVAQFLIQKGVFTAEQLVKAGVKVYPIRYLYTDEGGLTAAMLGVPFAESELTGLMGCTPPTSKPYIYAWKYGGGELVLYQMDCLTLQAAETGRLAWPDAETINITQYGDVGGRAYLGAANTAGGAKLIRVDGKTVSVPAEGDALGEHWDSYLDPPEGSHDGHWLTVTLGNTACVISPDGVTAHTLEPGVALVGVDYDGTAVHYREEDGFGVIEGVRVTDWTAVGGYRVDLSDPRINPEEPLIAYRLGKYEQYTGFPSGHGFYGEAGYFFTSAADGRLTRMTDRPVLDVTGLRIGAVGAAAILSHEPGETSGRTIYRYDGPSLTGKEGYVEREILPASDPPHGIDITDIYGADSAVFFYARKPVGMNLYDVFDYISWYNAEEGHSGIYVMSFTPGRPEISFAEHDEQWYIQQEQERLDKLGYNWS